MISVEVERMRFLSDNVTGASPEIIEALSRVGEDMLPAYGEDALTARVEAKLRDIFETDLAAFPVATGTSANALSLSVLVPPFGGIYCHVEAHIFVDECGAVEFYTAGARLLTLPGQNGKVNAAELEAALNTARRGVVHAMQPAALSITQATEAGTSYRPTEVAALCDVARSFGLKVHMDGSRFANALAFLDTRPADITWRAGVDILSFGATKNGALAGEVVIIFDKGLAQEFAYRRKRAGHLLSKMRFIAAQLDAYLTNDLWLRNATHANAMARKLAEGLQATSVAKVKTPVEANEVFVELPDTVIKAVALDGWPLRRWCGDDQTLVRLVTAFNTRQSDVTAFIEAVTRHSASDNVTMGADQQ